MSDTPTNPPILKHFRYAHLPEELQKISRPIGELATAMAATIPIGPELVAGLRKLLEAKDCLVRARQEELDRVAPPASAQRLSSSAT